MLLLSVYSINIHPILISQNPQAHATSPHQNYPLPSSLSSTPNFKTLNCPFRLKHSLTIFHWRQKGLQVSESNKNAQPQPPPRLHRRFVSQLKIIMF